MDSTVLHDFISNECDRREENIIWSMPVHYVVDGHIGPVQGPRPLN